MSIDQAAGGGGMCGDYFLGANLIPVEHRLNATDYLSIAADHVPPFMTAIHPSYNGHFHQI